MSEQRRLPTWFKVDRPGGANYIRLRNLLRDSELHTVCEEARCQNIGDCWNRLSATFMILGDICTRACRYCAVTTGRPARLNLQEPIMLARAVERLGLRYCVITSVDRDDLNDGGANHFAEVINQTKKINPSTTIEVLTPDFLRKRDSYKRVVEAQPDVFNHNIETVPSLYPKVRPGSRYFGSLELLSLVKKINKSIFTKSGIMLGLGETKKEVLQVMDDLISSKVDFLPIGQYLQPSVKHYPLKRYVHPDEFKELKSIALAKGFLMVASSPLTRSSYHADEDFLKLKKLREKESQCHSLQ